jgi:hypothetical protein
MDSSQGFQSFIAYEDRPPWWYKLGTIVIVLLAILCWTQTDSYVVFVEHFRGPTYEALRAHIAESKEFQAQLTRKSGKPQPTSNITHLMVETSELSKLEAAERVILSDSEFENRLQSKFGTDLRSVRAVVTLGWKSDNKGYCEEIGITRDGGWKDFEAATITCLVGGVTIRDRPGYSQRTLDGIPRIVLNPNALAYPSWTRLVMVHEMLHAMNIPGRDLPFPAMIQNDLTYLSEYRSYVDQYHLGTWTSFVCWSFAVLLILIAVISFRRYWGY